MSMVSKLARVKLAKARVGLARHRVGLPATALLARGRAHPLSTVGISAATGFALGRLNVHPLRLPGLGALLGGGLSELVTIGSRMIAELGVAGLGAAAAAEADRVDAEPHADQP
ncbi:hypothetical protein ASD22_12200 [Rhodanobacter sp. Root480]|jgi:hypothetical protein|uniref:DUF883 domain-containing protein n=1 Tax=Rhodanobacter ginsenosidimutans TaxID=490571 RepID=A0ABW0JR92_9GAMM|nr:MULTISPECIES: hypothetical protein [unclassified Rhodanobacter]KQX97950.1 hypothetical protein ASD22_12200 [Rhodanobacter sp. Root480]KRA33719.1 hypothetical protein ASD68_12255 [Rhodanobacter sp. Root627]